MSIFWYILALLSAIAILIITHELGHFVAARCLGIKVLRFSIGFGKVVFSKKTAIGTELAVSLIPLGGYVKMLDEREGAVAQAELSQAFNRQSLFKRTIVVAAGPLVNFVVAFFMLWIVYSLGIVQLKPILVGTVPQSIAAQAHMQANSVIVKINGYTVNNWSEVTFKLLNILGSKKALTIETNTETYRLNIANWRLEPLKPDPLRSLGLIPKKPSSEELQTNSAQYLYLQNYPIWQAGGAAWQQTIAYLHFNFLITYKLITGKISLKSLSGPLSLFKGIGQAINQGWVVYLYTLAILSVAVGFINLLPIPGLDGGHLLFLLLEWVRGKEISLATQVLAYRLGMISIVVLMLQGLTNDLLRF